MSMSSAAQQDEIAEGLDYRATGTDSVSGLKQVVAERLAAHRSRRAQELALEAERERATAQIRNQARSGTSRIREAVAARYEHSVSYREFLAAEAERASQQAQAEAEIAARNARAVAEAQMKLMEELDQWNQSEAEAQLESRPGPREVVFEEPRIEAVAERPSGSLTVRMYDDIGAARSATDMTQSQSRSHHVHPADGEDELDQLDQEIEFRRAPEFELHLIEAQPIPGNLIEFPRQLVASRKARPRLAEGPLREDAPVEPQLRIFEVEPEQISIEPEATEFSGAPEWQGLFLDPNKVATHAPPAEAQHHFTLQPQTAPLELRLMAASIDTGCIGIAFLGFAAVVAKVAGPNLRALSLPLLGVTTAGVLLALFVIFQLLFLSLAEATPGMRYARIALCTFGDANPSRKAMRRRVLAMLLAACPLGIGLAWAFLDDERLGWHDRMSKMYQRAY
ncbi:putative RDD family membrane protein YckC [Granulicella mallensis]|uniref:Putative RDD family membrane protein YckC n=2 Tax=Granulicella mallensis TaxID=940614 RepID=A0A7W7ZNM4_9BACT|nr:putative RDD family membrane protein YckC [Granulicella mallensis]